MLRSNDDPCPDRWVCTGASCSDDLPCPTRESSEVAYIIRVAGPGQQSEHLSLTLFGCEEPLDARKELASESILTLKRAEKYNDQWTRTTRPLTSLRVGGAFYRQTLNYTVLNSLSPSPLTRLCPSPEHL